LAKKKEKAEILARRERHKQVKINGIVKKNGNGDKG